jgi:mannitol/fructose-specific phosphotransferase system IIA component (Ntr-type)
MLVSPESRLEEHLGLLRWISRVARDGDFVSFIRQARTAQEILDVLHERAG